jgi:folylpolyglutamate synthase/dihydropteroate synthase
MRDKNIEEMAGTLSAVACTVYCCDVPGSGRGASASYIADIFRRYGSDAVVVPDAKQAYDEARGALGPDDALLITGSMYHVGLLRERVLAEVVP